MNKGDTVKIRDTKGVYRTVHQNDIIETARACITKKFKRDTSLTSASQAMHYVQMMLGGVEQEVFLVIFLDSQHRVIDAKEMFHGTIDGASIYPREVVKASLACNAAAVIFSHNHPSGVPDPSHADIRITGRLKSALELVDVRVLDHLIVGETVTSMAEKGLL